MLLFPNASSLYTQHISQVNGRGLSPALWRHLTTGTAAPDGSGGGIWFGDDFNNFSMNQAGDASGALALPTIQAVGTGTYHAYIDVGASAVQLVSDTAADWGGVVRLIGGDTDDDTMVIGTPEFLGYDVAQTLTTDPGQKLTIFEARVRLTNVTDGSAFIGLASKDMIANAALVASGDGGPLAASNALGFNVVEGDPDGWDFIHQATGQAEVRTASMQDAVASTWYKLGFVIDPTAPAAKRVKIYVDNVESSTYITATAVEGTTFPADVGLGLVAATMTETNGTEEKVLDIDWWAVYQAG